MIVMMLQGTYTNGDFWFQSEKKSNLIFHRRLMNVISKLGTSHLPPTKEKVSESMSPQVTSRASKSSLPPSLSTNALSATTGQENGPGNLLSDFKLKRQSLECLAAVLRSLVAWGTQTGKSVLDPAPTRTKSIDETRPEIDSPHGRSSLSLPGEVSRTVTPDVADDPGRFESAKQKKTTLLEGIKKFNFKAKRVCPTWYQFSICRIHDRDWNSSLKLARFPQTHPKILLASFCTQMVLVRP